MVESNLSSCLLGNRAYCHTTTTACQHVHAMARCLFACIVSVVIRSGVNNKVVTVIHYSESSRNGSANHALSSDGRLQSLAPCDRDD